MQILALEGQVYHISKICAPKLIASLAGGHGKETVPIGGGERVEVDKGYSFSMSTINDGIKIDIAIETTKKMAMPELLKKFAASSHAMYLEVARDISEGKHS